MNKPLSTVEIRLFAQPVMSRRDKLLRLASLVRGATIYPIYIFSGLERCDQTTLDYIEQASSAFALAANDPVLQDAGLKSGTVGAAQRFFELSLNDLHEFSCDCGGLIGNDTMAQRIEKIAGK